MPNSAATLTDPVDDELADVLDRTRLVRGGGGLEVSLLGLRIPASVIGIGLAVSLDGRRQLGRGPGADGVRAGVSIGSLGLGKVSERCAIPKGCGSSSSSPLDGGPNPPYPFFLGALGAPLMLPTLLLRLDMAVPGRSYSSGAFRV